MPKEERAGDNETLIGIVTPIQWDDHDRVTAVSLCATDDEEYLIEDSARFIDLAQKCIEARVWISRDHKTPRRIAIKRFNIIESF